MLISTRGRYALRVMVDLAENNIDEYIPLKEITDKENISKEYLNNILKILVKNNLLISLRGKGGGYKLIKPAKEYSVGEILRPIEENLSPVPCVSGSEPCPRSSECKSLPMWRKLDKLINDFFDNITLEDLLK